MRAGVLVLVAVLSGCIDDHLVHCPSPQGDIACAAGSVCVASGCASAAEAKACATLPENGPCMVDKVDGRCIGGACRTPICGNHIVEGDEQCDDGNLTSGDGCAGNCASNETCGNGVTDFVNGEQCDDNNLEDGDTCLHDCTVPRCGDGVVEPLNGENCDEGAGNSNAPGAACRTNCQPARCGDSVLDPGEVCDDANVVAGDGCSSDCRSNETCGNGIVDGIRNEQCDDGNRALSRDGCTSGCTVETPDWRQLPAALPTARYSYGVAYDSTRQRLVVFGGTSANVYLADTWELVQSTWVKVDVPSAPAPRSDPSMAYDPIRKRVVVFGGFGGAGGAPAPLDDTWEYDGVTWTRIVTATLPGARSGAPMVFDPSRGKLVMFGGGAPYTNEVWTYDGLDWTLVATTNPPSARSGSSIAYDTAGSRIVVFGGIDPSFARLSDSYQLVGTTWTALSSGPSGADTSLTYDQSRNRLVLVTWTPGTPSLVHTYELVGSSWSDTTPSSSNITARADIQIQYVSTCSCVVTLGGITLTPNTFDTWTYDGSAWKQLVPVQAPHAGSYASIDYDSRRGAIVLFGGADPVTGAVDETWEHSRGYWTPILASGPSKRFSQAMAYDASRDRIVLFGGYPPSGTPLADTWELDGKTWSQATPTASPPPTYAHAIAYDAGRHRIVMFGGYNALTKTVADTYEYNGTTWTLMSPTASPPARASTAMGYDPRRQRMVLFGGYSGTQYLADTWEYDGATWIPVSSALPEAPSGRQGATLTFDVARGKLILFGGRGSSGYLDDTWEYDGTNWTPVNPSSAPPPRQFAGAAYDPVAGQTVVYAGQQSTGTGVADTWSLSWSSNAFPAEGCRFAASDADADGLAGCADPDCWARCTPQCPPRTSCDTALPHCGDGVCAPVEDYLICPADC